MRALGVSDRDVLLDVIRDRRRQDDRYAFYRLVDPAEVAAIAAAGIVGNLAYDAPAGMPPSVALASRQTRYGPPGRHGVAEVPSSRSSPNWGRQRRVAGPLCACA
jgi:hypothetical protein